MGADGHFFSVCWRIGMAAGLLACFCMPPLARAGTGVMEFHCPRAYQGIKPDMLPSYWEPTDQGRNITAGQSHVQGKYMICIYREPGGRPIGNVRRLVPQGYHCITDGRGVFQCRRK